MDKGKILVVDDEENIRGALYGILTDEGYSVSLAEDGETALRMIRANPPDLALLDIWIPGIDGIQTLRILKKISQDTEVVMMSGHGAIDTAVKATKLGAFDFVEKPFTLETILKAVSGALAARAESRGHEAKRPAATPARLESWFAGPSILAAQTMDTLEKAAEKKGPILICGPAGSGKEMAARLIHRKSRDGAFVKVECEKLTEENFVQALFGHPSSPGQGDAPVGLVRGAAAGTLFFDRLGLLSHRMQRKLAKMLAENVPSASKEEGIQVIGAAPPHPERGGKGPALIKPLESYFGGVAVRIYPLDERPGDIPELVRRLTRDLAEKYGKKINAIDDGLIDAIGHTSFKGNTRELYNFLELAVLACEGTNLTGEYISIAGKGSFAPARSAVAHTGRAQAPEGGAKGTQEMGPAGARRGAILQRTLKNSVVLCGEGLHSGLKTGIILSPLPPDSGIVFWDISSGRRVPALIENIRSTDYSTTLSSGDVTIKTVEHILSALHSYRITNLLIKIGDEAPIMDGSAVDFCQILESGGIEEQEAELEPIIIKSPLTVGDTASGPCLTVEPSDGFSIRYFLDYPPPIGEQEHLYVHESAELYKSAIAPARTFGFLKDIKQLEEAGLASGGRLSNVILIGEDKVLNTPLRFDNEPARHKILDLMGDLYLLGRPVRGHFTARKSGHTQNIAMVEKINETYGAPAWTKRHAAPARKA